MVVCKYFQQGTCRYGQYCKYEHSFGNRTKTFEHKNIALQVAEEILEAEKGGQWLLSAYGPFKEKKCIPGMDDLSPEEVRWQMYQAQKTGTTEQIKAHFQQLCKDMKTKTEALKNPTPAIVKLLEDIQKSGIENKGNFAFGAAQHGNQPSNVFVQNNFGASASNIFGGSNAFNPTQTSNSIFGKPATNNSLSVFGGKPTFGGTSIFNNSATPASSIFGGGNKSTTTPFGSVQNTPSFGGLAAQDGAAHMHNYMQQSAFGANANQNTNAFLKPQTAQMSVFQPATNVFGGATATTNLTGNSIFGQSAAPSSAFGAAPAFGKPASFVAIQNSGASVFGGQVTAFGAAPVVSSSANVFGGANTATASFGTLAQGVAAPAFGAASTTSVNAFETAPNASPFGAPTSLAVASFDTMDTGITSEFATAAAVAAGPFGATPFSKATSFGLTTPATIASTNVFGVTATVNTTAQTPFGATSFGIAQPTSNPIFATSTLTASPAPVSNPFMKPQQQTTASPFGVAPSSQTSPFGNFTTTNTNAFGVSMMMTVDETAYTLDECLTDDEKAIYRMNQFPEGLIPLKPPTKELS